MIRVTVELVSANGRARDRVLGRAEIVNMGTGDASHGNYRATFYGATKVTRTATDPGRLWRACELYGWPRNRWHPWLLVLFCLWKAVGWEMFERVRRPLRKSGGRERARLGVSEREEPTALKRDPLHVPWTPSE